MKKMNLITYLRIEEEEDESLSSPKIEREGLKRSGEIVLKNILERLVLYISIGSFQHHATCHSSMSYFSLFFRRNLVLRPTKISFLIWCSLLLCMYRTISLDL